MFELRFEWNETKAEANFQKHGVAFETAIRAFMNAFGIDELDESMNYGEQRFRLLAKVSGIVLLIVYSERDGTIRIISARQATRREYDRYYRENTQD